MSKKALRKDFYMELKNTKSRFISIFIIVALGVAFFSGVRSTEPDMRLSADKFYDESNLMDIRVISTLGLTNDDVNEIKNVDGVNEVEPAYSLDVTTNTKDKQLVLKVMSLTNDINKVSIKEGRLPENDKECFVDSRFIEVTDYKIGDKIKINSGTDTPLDEELTNTEYEIVGIGSTAYYLSRERGTSNIGNGSISSFISIVPEAFKNDVYTEVYLTVDGAKDKISYSDEYDDMVENITEKIEDISSKRCDERYNSLVSDANEQLDKLKLQYSQMPIPELKDKITEVEGQIKEIKKPEWYVLDRNTIQTYVEYDQDAEKIGAIGEVFPVIFFLVAALVSLTTMTRMVEEQRTQIGTLKALGYGKISIAGKFIIYGLIATIGGSVFGFLLGEKILPQIIINAYTMLYVNLPEVVAPLNMYYAVLSTVIAVSCTMIATVFACYKTLMASPAELMRPVAPAQGKRVFLERITFIWKRLSFTQKSTVRNLIRYKKRFFMTVFGIGGCMALLLVGFGLKDSIFGIANTQYGEILLYDADVAMKDDSTEEDKKSIIDYINKNSSIKESIRVKGNTIDVESSTEKKSANLFVPEDNEKIDDYVVFRNRSNHEKYKLDDNGVLITEKLASILDVKPGDTIYLKDGEIKKIEVKVNNIVENYMFHYVYISPKLYEELYNEKPDYNKVLLKNSDNSNEFEDSLASDILQQDGVASINFSSSMTEDIEEILGNLNIVVWVLIISAGLLAFVVLYNLNNINITERQRELATLKVLGFYDNEVAQYVYRENILLTIIGAAVGVVFGFFLHKYVILTAEVDMMMFGRDIHFISYVYSVLLTFLFSAFVNFVMYFKLKKINMIESLKSVE